MDVEKTVTQILGAAYAVHTALGPGLLEAVYQTCMLEELRARGIPAEAQVAVPVIFRDKRIELAYRADIVVGREILIELKSVAEISPMHCAQTINYIRLGHFAVGLLLNFNVLHFRDGIRRFSDKSRLGAEKIVIPPFKKPSAIPTKNPEHP